LSRGFAPRLTAVLAGMLNQKVILLLFLMVWTVNEPVLGEGQVSRRHVASDYIRAVPYLDRAKVNVM